MNKRGQRVKIKPYDLDFMGIVDDKPDFRPWNIKKEVQKKCDENPEFKEKWEERKRLMNEFEKAAKPLVEFLQNNYSTNAKVIVECDRAELLEGEMMTGFYREG